LQKNAELFGQFKKKQYFCTRFQKIEKILLGKIIEAN